MRAFNVRVAIVEPGVIATPILTKGYRIPAGGPYPHARRITALFAAGLASLTPPSVVGDLIRDIVDGTAGSFATPRGPTQRGRLKGGRARRTSKWLRRPPRATTNLSRGSSANSGSTLRCDWRTRARRLARCGGRARRLLGEASRLLPPSLFPERPLKPEFLGRPVNQSEFMGNFCSGR
jgi:hypothetical protein